MPYAKTDDGVKLYYKDWGEGPAVVLIHGWPLDADMWEYQALSLAEAGYRVISYDRRGFGRSEQPFGNYSYDRLADDLRSVIKETGVKDATLVGFSMGGGEVCRYMSRHKGKDVAKTALIASVAPYMLKTSDNPDGVEESVFEDIKAGIRKDRAAFFEDFGKNFFGWSEDEKTVSAAYLGWTHSIAMMASPYATLACVDSFGKTDFRQDLKSFDTPTLVIHGTGDAIVPIDPSGRQVKKLVPKAELKEYDGAPHGLIATEPERVTNDLLAFLKS